MFSLAYVLMPFSDTPPAEAIRSSLARFQRGRRGDLPESWLAFHDETEELREEHEATLTLTELETGGVQIAGKPNGLFHIDWQKLREEMRRRGLRRWTVRLADEMSLEECFSLFAQRLERHPETGAYGRWLNPIGRWDWWDVGGPFDCRIMGEGRMTAGRSSARISSGANRGRMILANVEDALGKALGQEPVPDVDVGADRNIEFVETLLDAAQRGLDHAFPGDVVLPPGAVEDRLRWLSTWPKPEPAEGFAWLGLPPDASWTAVVTAAYARFSDHWAAGVAYHH